MNQVLLAYFSWARNKKPNRSAVHGTSVANVNVTLDPDANAGDGEDAGVLVPWTLSNSPALPPLLILVAS